MVISKVDSSPKVMQPFTAMHRCSNLNKLLPENLCRWMALLTGLPPFSMQSVPRIRYSAWRTHKKHAQRMSWLSVLPALHMKWCQQMVKPWVSLAFSSCPVLNICLLLTGFCLAHKQLGNTKDIHKNVHPLCQWFNKSLPAFWNHYLTLFDGNMKCVTILLLLTAAQN